MIYQTYKTGNSVLYFHRIIVQHTVYPSRKLSM